MVWVFFYLENFVDIIKQGEVITIRNCKLPILNGHMRMQVDAFGKIEPCNSVFINDVKMDNDLSAQVYDNFHQRRRYGGHRNYGQEYGHNQGNFAENKSYQTYSVNDTQSVGTFLSSQI